MAAAQGQEVGAPQVREMRRIVVELADDEITLLQEGSLQPQVVGAGDDHPLLEEDLLLAGPGPVQLVELESGAGQDADARDRAEERAPARRCARRC